MRFLALIMATLPALALAREVRPQSASVVYGVDDRIEVYEASPAMKLLARSTAVKMNFSSLMSKDSHTFAAPQVSLVEYGEVCETERFASQPTASECSGFLVGPDLLVTAGHCVDDQADCDNSTWVFDYQLDPITKTAGLAISDKNMYRCQKIIKRVEDDNTLEDFAIVQLDRIVPDRAPLKVRSEGKVPNDAALTVIGSPSSLPTKVASGGRINENSKDVYFTASMDSFHGNSGAAVFNDKTLEVEGILVRGDTDYVLNAENSCSVVNVCPMEGCDPESDSVGEDITRMTAIIELRELKNMGSAALNGDDVPVSAYLAEGGWVDMYDNNRESILIKAAQAQSLSVATVLMNADADVKLKDLKDQTALHHLAKAKRFRAEGESFASALIAKGALVDAQDNMGNTALHVAVKNKHMKLVELLLDAGANPTIKNRAGQSAADLCKWYSLKQRKIRRLLGHAANNG